MKFFAFIAIFLIAVSAQAAGTIGVGVSSNKNIDNVGVSILTGVQSCIDSSRQIYLRSEFEKVNWGNGYNLDNIGLKTIIYYDLPFWGTVNEPLKFGVHFTGTYQTQTSDLGAAFGGEFYKCFWKNTVGAYFSADIANVPNVDDYFIFGAGLILGKF